MNNNISEYILFYYLEEKNTRVDYADHVDCVDYVDCVGCVDYVDYADCVDYVDYVECVVHVVQDNFVVLDYPK